MSKYYHIDAPLDMIAVSYNFVAKETTGKLFLEDKHFSLSMNREFDLILRSCSKRALFIRRSWWELSASFSCKVENWNKLKNKLVFFRLSRRDWIIFWISHLSIEQIYGLCNLTNFFNKSVEWRIPAEFDIRPMCSCFQSRLWDLFMICENQYHDCLFLKELIYTK